jgi:MYXO-CTERM domain-containing protein
MDLDVDTEVKTRLIGVTSHAYDNSDCDEKGGVDTRVDHYLAWIDAEMSARCADGTRSWCDEPGIIPVPMREGGGGCGCVVAPVPVAGGLWSLGLVALLGLRRRRA